MNSEVHNQIKELEAKLEELRSRVFRTTWYVHGNFSHGEMLEAMDLSEDDVGPDVNFKYAVYEAEFDVEVDLQTGDYKILEVRDNGQVLVPQESA